MIGIKTDRDGIVTKLLKWIPGIRVEVVSQSKVGDFMKPESKFIRRESPVIRLTEEDIEEVRREGGTTVDYGMFDVVLTTKQPEDVWTEEALEEIDIEPVTDEGWVIHHYE